ncbi:hypothetical protein SARC_07098 [Sphaeroforma arctica JP610]|uniref:MINDY deubiquitinase domain-containing protein n=1 Tax=Sphaeroforma arctica JP610 TaxID=667725 RepID=A0A0L0FVG6_9EUKA|nr:hypothetical protein SARC_07098 [Sphaeroforma arctica JP610]KNC80551.1 hypothetical protein SARC_07098 [Sphaeroforma arctica JP610]|eukprot:XP_014154453.1 hypothetical protein SARC_07098 [Sphaeroforma arctica JP610]
MIAFTGYTQVVAYHEVTESGTTTSFENLKDNTTVQTGMTIANFLEATASQLTLYGIQQLRSRLRNGDLGTCESINNAPPT